MQSNYKTSLDSVVISNSDGKTFDITQGCESIDLFESMFAMYMTGSIQYKDAGNFLDNLTETDTWLVSIAFSNPKYSRTIVMQIGAIEDVKKIDYQTKTYTLVLYSPEYIKQQNIRISKGYSGTKKAIISDILLNLSNKSLITDKDTRKSLLLSPRMKPFDLIDFVLLFDKSSPDYMFWENTRGYNLLSLTSIYNKDPQFNFYETNINNISDKDLIEGDVENNPFIIRGYTTPKLKDIITPKEEGFEGATLLVYDPLVGVSNKYTMSSDQYNNKVFMFNENSMNYSNYLQRHSRLSRFNMNEMYINVKGNYQVSCGDLISAMFLKSPNEPGVSNSLSGKYIISSIRHKINTKEYLQELSISK